MAITPFDLRQLVYGDDADVQDICYNFKGATELGVLTTLTALRHLSVSFNDFVHVKGIQQLQFLQHLDISHNRINSLESVSCLTNLISLNAGHNKLRSAAPLQNLPSLIVLGLHSNDICQPSSVLLLSQLTALQHLMLAGNPVCYLPNWHEGVIAALPSLQALNSSTITQADKTAAQPHASTLQQLAAAVDQDCIKPGAYSDTGSSAPATKGIGSSSRHAAVQSKTATGHISQSASSNAGDTSIKDAAALLPVISVPSLKPSTLVMRADKQQGSAANSIWSRAVPVKEVCKQWYDADSGGTAAVTVRSDGSASLLWPDGSMAATLDAETGFDGAYRLLAMYRSIVGVAASFDSNGGFVQYPTGGLMLVWNKKDGIGTAYAPDGAVTHSFNSRRRAVGLKHDIRQQLDQHYSIVFVAKTYELQLKFNCDGHQLGLSVLHGAQLSQQDAAAEVRTATPSTLAVAPAEDSTQAMLARARAVMAADFAAASSGAVPSGPPVALTASTATAATNMAKSLQAADHHDKDSAEHDMHALLARARALMAATDADLVSQA